MASAPLRGRWWACSTTGPPYPWRARSQAVAFADASSLSSTSAGTVVPASLERIRRGSSTRGGPSQVRVGILEKHRPVLTAHRVFTGADVIPERAVDECVGLRH